MKNQWAKRGTIEKQVKELHNQGYTYFQIAEKLDIALSTVAYHLSERYRKSKLMYSQKRYRMFVEALKELKRLKG